MLYFSMYLRSPSPQYIITTTLTYLVLVLFFFTGINHPLFITLSDRLRASKKLWKGGRIWKFTPFNDLQLACKIIFSPCHFSPLYDFKLLSLFRASCCTFSPHQHVQFFSFWSVHKKTAQLNGGLLSWVHILILEQLLFL